MSDSLNFIKSQRALGINDYMTLQSVKKYSGKSSYNMKGGDDISDADIQDIKRRINEIKCLLDSEEEKKVDDADYSSYITIQTKYQNENDNKQLPEKYKTIDELRSFLETYKNKLVGQPTPEIADEYHDKDQTHAQNDQSNVSVSAFETLQMDVPIYHPSTNIKRFSDAMIFVDLPQVLDQSKQRSFSMFFTPNEEYAKRYSGLWSLNKRPVYVHKLKVKQPITGIKVIHPNAIPDHIDNLDLAKNFCGDTIDGHINGIKIDQVIDNEKPISEYYICNPSVFFAPDETWMQFGSTEWVKIEKSNTQSIKVPGGTSKTNSAVDNELGGNNDDDYSSDDDDYSSDDDN
jgi:hypothetical protein